MSKSFWMSLAKELCRVTITAFATYFGLASVGCVAIH